MNNPPSERGGIVHFFNFKIKDATDNENDSKDVVRPMTIIKNLSKNTFSIIY